MENDKRDVHDKDVGFKLGKIDISSIIVVQEFTKNWNEDATCPNALSIWFIIPRVILPLTIVGMINMYTIILSACR